MSMDSGSQQLIMEAIQEVLDLPVSYSAVKVSAKTELKMHISCIIQT